jgi:phage head maturation protease
VGFFERIGRALRLVQDVESSRPRFAVDAGDIDPAVFGLTSYASPIAPAPRVSRREAMQVGAVKRGRDLIAGGIGTLPLQMFAPDKTPARRDLQQLLDQPEPDVPRSVTMTRTIENLMFEERAWWRVLQLGSHGFPVKVRRLDPRSVNVKPDGKVYVSRGGQHQGTGEEWVPDDQLIRFDSPNDALLVAGARAIRTALMIDSATQRYSEDPVPLGWFESIDDADPFEDADDPNAAAQKFLDEWAAARRARAWGFVPPGLKLANGNWSPREMQMADARSAAVVELARVMGVDPEDLGVSTTSRTYFNAESKRKDKLDFTLLGYIAAVQDRLTMPDVTPRGYFVRFNLDAFLRTDTLTRYQSYEIGQRVGAIDGKREVRELEDKPPLSDPESEEDAVSNQPDQEPSNVRELPVAASRFAGEDAVQYRLDAPQATEAFAVDIERRTIRGLAVPYGKTARAQGKVFQFARGSLRFGDPTRVKLWIGHDPTRAVGYATALEDTEQGLVATFKVARGERGDEALIMAEDRVWDGLSAGLAYGARFEEREGVFHAVDAPVAEISLTPSPAFDDARVHAVAASADTEGNIQMTTTTVTPAADATTTQQQTPQTPDVESAVSAALARFGINPDQPTFSAEAVTRAIEQGFAQLQRPQITTEPGGPAQTAPLPGRETVSAGGEGSAQFQVREESPYRFDGSSRGQHCFTDDLRDMQNGNSEAKARLLTFMQEAHEQFAVTSANVSAFNPTQPRPELYVPQLRFTRPLWESVSTGVIQDKTPFTVPKFGAAAGLAGDHTEGVEPTPGSFSATVQTVTPSAISGKVEINREVWDQGGNPQTDTIVWNEMQNAYFEAIEAKIAAMLNAIAAANLYSGAEVNLAGAVDGALQTAMTNLLVDLQFVRGGNRYTAAAADAVLYKALVGAKDTAGRALFPLLGATNAQGEVSPLAAGVNVLGQVYRPAWALNTGVANARNSYQFVPTSVWQWASAPKRFTFEYQVKSIDMAVWGYTGGAVLRESDVIRIDHSTADV